MSTKQAFLGCEIFDGQTTHVDCALLIDGADCKGVISETEIPLHYERVTLAGGVLSPGFLDLQVNGGGGVMFNDDPSVEGLRQFAEAHARFGTTSLLPTLITDTPDKTTQAIAAVKAAIDAGVPGIAGLHLEGPHLSVAKKGAHDPKLIRPMTDADLAELIEAAKALPHLLLTIAVENVTQAQVADLGEAGAVVSLGHTEATYSETCAYVDAGASMATHVFNAMSQLGSREPGLVGAALDLPGVSAGVIADGVHVHPASLARAWAAKSEPGSLFLVTDAMATVGTDQSEFMLGGRKILRRNGVLTLEDGKTLAGADLDMATAIRNLIELVGLDRTTALNAATEAPANAIGNARLGRLFDGGPADFVHLDDGLEPLRIWRSGRG